MLNWLNSLLRRDQVIVAPIAQVSKEAGGYYFGPPTMAGVSVSEEIAQGLTAVYRAITLKASTISSLSRPVFLETPERGAVEQRLHYITQLLKDPNDYQNPSQYWNTLLNHVESSGNGYSEIERVGRKPVGLHIRHWRNVAIEQSRSGGYQYRLINSGKVIPAANMLHVTGMSSDGIKGISPIMACRESLGVSIAAERYAASVFSSGAVPRGILKVKGVPNEETKTTLRETWQMMHGGLENANRIGFLPDNAEWIATNMTPEDCQLLLTRAFGIQEVSRIFGVPESMLFGGKGSYNSDEQSNIAFYETCLLPTLKSLESELNTKLLTREERFDGYAICHKVEALMRGVYQSKAKTVVSLKVAGICTTNEARIKLDLPPLDQPGANDLMHPSNLQQTPDGNGGSDVAPAGESNDEVPPEQGENEHTPRSLVREALKDQIARGLRREAKSLPRPAELRAYLVEALAPTYEAYRAIHALDVSVNEFADRWVDYTLDKAVESVGPEEILALAEQGGT